MMSGEFEFDDIFLWDQVRVGEDLFLTDQRSKYQDQITMSDVDQSLIT